MWFGLVSLFPEMFEQFTSVGVFGRAVSSGLVEVSVTNPRDFAFDKHRVVDDRPYGGGPGMLMKVQPLRDAIESAKRELRDSRGIEGKVIYLSPQGRKLDDALSRDLSQEQGLICVSGRYEGIDERVIESHIDLEVSIGDYVLSGGEIASMVLMDAVARHVKGVLGHSSSANEDSFADGLLDCPHYTRPEVLDGQKVPDVLLSGDHERIRKWRVKQSLCRTYERRPDLLDKKDLTREQKQLLDEFLKDVNR
ncbi:tRNA (guanosine(37)-N1)-methyltransferase TrmD [Oleiphilus sp. HI0071]|uniref:tRNA (guanosine(37)-N1)-methyltransferase TrmD n=1 Tax=unclassified Oleiphilus TaxID=2631174 RepID=UPI0007C2BBC7|nr:MULTISPECIES: tRNA (guanosine(37)-N1)-methyltransferase TrmD [unclassified Oleiphilus]KZY70151.1 tRNA (guanosine(37)-N1)-methyltransferase TrmD [Oleiphilus sp. HI0065]KZY83381.1 tRNA (guanosine(37)-N1)-methyltransferase TrmD [Oleiphilus sp. HI0071]KZY91052.1 tRNA (guanosine(37)-N1)-methyltransferase TrmD [Oleiphilus sp. HI0073]KZZ42074.1 tRNA (guanosine(37)-N1)-methyltransferase TrmD [Oleiphilus sp. HI0118]KZZ60478.1 tRNA (guanosine(37)-N1)-methyltransferase TrmD [Oleiphilus sp. HI0122]KZZ